MFSGFIEVTAKVLNLEKEGSNLNITMSCPEAGLFNIGQYVTLNDVCLTVTNHTITDITVTAKKRNRRPRQLELFEGGR